MAADLEGVRSEDNRRTARSLLPPSRASSRDAPVAFPALCSNLRPRTLKPAPEQVPGTEKALAGEDAASQRASAIAEPQRSASSPARRASTALGPPSVTPFASEEVGSSGTAPSGAMPAGRHSSRGPPSPRHRAPPSTPSSPRLQTSNQSFGPRYNVSSSSPPSPRVRTSSQALTFKHRAPNATPSSPRVQTANQAISPRQRAPNATPSSPRIQTSSQASIPKQRAPSTASPRVQTSSQALKARPAASSLPLSARSNASRQMLSPEILAALQPLSTRGYAPHKPHQGPAPRINTSAPALSPRNFAFAPFVSPRGRASPSAVSPRQHQSPRQRGQLNDATPAAALPAAAGASQRSQPANVPQDNSSPLKASKPTPLHSFVMSPPSARSPLRSTTAEDAAVREDVHTSSSDRTPLSNRDKGCERPTGITVFTDMQHDSSENTPSAAESLEGA